MIIAPTEENISLIVKSLISGKVIIFPTDTVFGIGCVATNDKAIEKIYKLKGRDFNKSFLLNVANKDAIKKIAITDNRTEQLIDRFMPGALSIICKANPNNDLSEYVINNGNIGVRIPNNKMLQDILEKVKIPVISTSCNKSSDLPVISSVMAEKIFPQITILQETEKLLNKSSTIIDATQQKIKYIREGVIKFQEIEQFLNNIKN